MKKEIGMENTGEFGSKMEKADIPSVLPENFSLPDLNLPTGKEYVRHSEVEFSVSHKGKNWLGRLSFDLSSDDDNLGDMRFQIYDPDDKEKRIANFASRLWRKDDSIMNEKYPDEKGRSCHIFNRNVEELTARRKGLGELSMKAVEEILKKINKEYPDLRMDKVHVFTRLGALSRLLVKLGYSPHPSDLANAQELLKLETASLHDIDYSRDPEVLFTKVLE